MKKSKIAAGVLLLAMGLTPVNSGLSYADDIDQAQVEESTQEENAQTETTDKTTKDTDTIVENKDELEISDEKEMENQQANDVEPLVEDFSMEEFINNKVSEISATKLYKIATSEELTAFNASIESLKTESKDLGEDKSEDVANKIEEYSKVLGKTVVYAKPYRTRLRILTKIADNKLAKEKNEDLSKANKEAKDLIHAKDTSLESLSDAGQKLLDLVGTYDLDNESLEEIYKLDGYPGEVLESFTEDDFARGLDELELEKEAYLKDSKRYSEDSLKQLEEGEQLVTKQAEITKKYKNAVEELRNASGEEAINEKINALTQPAYDMDNMVIQYNKKVKEKAEANEEYEKALNDTEFEGKEAYKRTSKEYKDKYVAAKSALEKEKNEKNLKALNDIKADIIKNSFAAKLAELRAAIDNPEEKNVSDEEFERIKKQYHEKLDAIENDKEKTLDDLLAFEKDELPTYKKLVNPEKEGGASGTTGTTGTTGNKKKVAKKVTTKKSKGKVRTGVESILPIAGGVAVVAAIALFLTRKKK